MRIAVRVFGTEADLFEDVASFVYSVHFVLPVIVGAVRPGGVAIFSGMEQPEAEEFRRVLTDAGFTLEQETLDAGWWGVAAELPR